MPFGSDVSVTLDDSRVATPSPTGTEHHDDDSSRESILSAENNSSQEKKIYSEPAGKRVLERVDSDILQIAADATAMALSLPTAVASQTEKVLDEMVDQESTREVSGEQQEAKEEEEQQAVGDIEADEVLTRNPCESSGIDPDGSTECLSSAQSLSPTESKKERVEKEELKVEEDQQVDNAKDEVQEERGHTPQDSTFGDESAETSSPVPSRCDKEPRDAPSAASDLDTASESADDKDEASPEKEIVEIEVNNPTTELEEAATATSLPGDGSKPPTVVETVEENPSDDSDPAEVDASGAIARSNSKAAGINDHYNDDDVANVSHSELEAAAENANDSHSSAASKRPMDASGRLSVEIETLLEKPALHQDPIGDHGKKVVASILKESSASNGEASAPQLVKSQPPEPVLTTIAENKQQMGLPTPREAMEKATTDAAIRAATEPPDEIMISDAQLPLGLLANRDKESFALLARGESFKNSQHQNQQQQQHQQTIPSEHDPLYGHRRPSSQLQQLQHEHDANRRRENGFVSVSRSNSGRPEDFQRMLDDNSMSRPIEDTSWRPSQVSYPSSPQAFVAPQAMTFNNGYLMMPQHQMQQIPPGQPPHAYMAQHPAMLAHQSSFHSQQSQLLARPSYPYAPVPAMQTAMQPPMPSPGVPVPGGKRKIKLKLQEEILARPSHTRRSTFFFGRSTRKLMTSQPLPENEQVNEVDRGTITVSWFEGTSSLELHEHVNRSVQRKLKLDKAQQLDDIRILDTKFDPPEEIVLCPYIPSGSEFVLRYKLKLASGRSSPNNFYGPPDSPSAAPSPHPSNIGGLDPTQLATLRKQLDSVQAGEKRREGRYRSKARKISPMKPFSPDVDPGTENTKKDQLDDKSTHESDGSDAENDNDSDTLKPESSVDAKLRQITELLLMDKKAQMHRYQPVGKRQVIFVLANYFVLFIAFITLLAEAQARAPEWLTWMENQLENVQNCSADQEALFKCVSNGEFAGLFATVILWISRSATTKKIFLLGFDSPEKLWIVFYESLVGAFCWGVSYMFIRRGMNPDTRPQFLHKYWKDAVYGSLAGFNATFMKAVLKNLIPREAVEEAFGDRQLKILSWLPSFA